MSLSIYSMIIELTRRCDLKCAHCLRGPQENADLTRHTIGNALRGVDYISCLTLTGGEPSLNPKAIRWVAEEIRCSSTRVDSWYIVTNGARVNRRFLSAVEELDRACDNSDRMMSALAMSHGFYHGERDTAWYRMQEWSEETGIRIERRTDSEHVINMGRAGGFGFRPVGFPRVQIEVYGDDISLVEAEAYVTTRGVVYPSCDLSYEVMRKNRFLRMGNVNDTDFDWLEAYKSFNKRMAQPVGYVCEDGMTNAQGCLLRKTVGF